MQPDPQKPSDAPEQIASSALTSAPQITSSARTLAFHLPALLLGGIGVMPLLYLFFADIGLMDSESASAYLYVFREQPFRAALLGIIALAPSMYAFGSDLRFSLRRYILAIAGILLLMLMALTSAFRSGLSAPVPIGGGILGVLVTAVLGFAGTATFDRLARRTPPATLAAERQALSTRATVSLIIAAILLVGGTWLYYGLRGPETEYLGVRLGMSSSDVKLLRGAPYAVGDPAVTMLPDGRILSLSEGGVPMEQVLSPSDSQPLQPLKPREEKTETTAQDLVRAAAEAGRAAAEAAIAAERAPLSERHRIVRQLLEQPIQSAGWRAFPDVLVNASEAELERANSWFYEIPSRQGIMRLQFDPDRRLAGIWCVEIMPSGCPSLRGVRAGVDEDAVWRVLGAYSLGVFSPKTRVLKYRIMNLRFYLNQERVYMLGIEEPICIDGRCE